jgi:acetyl esterase/lipase
LALATGFRDAEMLVSVEYRLSSEAKFPAAVQVVFAAVRGIVNLTKNWNSTCNDVP